VANRASKTRAATSAIRIPDSAPRMIRLAALIAASLFRF
jgi:hypothetical protein